MTLEKLLIFGFAMAVLVALTVQATRTADTRGTQRDGWKDKVQVLRDMAR